MNAVVRSPREVEIRNPPKDLRQVQQKNLTGAVFLQPQVDLRPLKRMATPSTGVESAAIGTRPTSHRLMFVVPCQEIANQPSIWPLIHLLGL